MLTFAKSLGAEQKPSVADLMFMVDKIVNSLSVTVSKPLYTEVPRGCHHTDDRCSPYRLEVQLQFVTREREYKASALYLWLVLAVDDQSAVLEALNR
jgi:hypothetical protein